ncbi:hypothetical protein [uncultured Methanobrevibacter sp.]|uniref:DUF7487 domain-containing protein n=1 Tax=uncultured Methanobrevibacter sp. TaxID=253161 RepID=UPI0025FB0166|nr:hypothetical protein [uncultured Methanobrevibacter sp.]
MKYSKDILEDYIKNRNNGQSIKQYISKHIDWLNDILKFQKDFNFQNFTFPQLLYHYCYDILEQIVCESGNPKKFKSFGEGYTVTCIHKYECFTCKKQVKYKTAETNLKKYGNICSLHGKEIELKTKRTNLKRYNAEYPTQSNIVKEKTKKTNLEKYGTEYTFQNECIKQKIKQTNLERYGVEYSCQNINIRNKIKNTNLKKYGVECNSKSESVKQKIKKTNLERYGNACSLHGEEIKLKVAKTNIRKYGVANPMQNENILEKSQKHSKYYKKYMFPSGKTIFIQGYENFALDKILSQNILEKNIFVSSKEYTPLIGKIYYNINQEVHRYFPDIIVKEDNKYIIYEIKSLYTYKLGQENNELELKMMACNAAGYDAIVMVFDNKGILLFENKYNK